jgi:hypothetical protein
MPELVDQDGDEYDRDPNQQMDATSSGQANGHSHEEERPFDPDGHTEQTEPCPQGHPLTILPAGDGQPEGEGLRRSGVVPT